MSDLASPAKQSSSTGLLRSSVIIVVKKAAVFPVPVCALPTISCPLSVYGNVLACIGEQY